LMTMGITTTVPVTHLTQAMSWIEAGMGQVYLTVLVARLVSLHVAAAERHGWPPGWSAPRSPEPQLFGEEAGVNPAWDWPRFNPGPEVRR
jgi:hypothetical protein